MVLLSAYGYKRTLSCLVINVRFTPNNGHFKGSRKESVNDAVDGSHPTASRCAKVWLLMNHREIGAAHERSYHNRS